MKKIFSLLGAILMLISLTGCVSAKPEATVEKFFTAAQKFDTATMASTIVPTNTEDIDEMKGTFNLDQLTEKEMVIYDYLSEYLKSNAAKMTFKVTGSEINGESALVTVDCKYVDAVPLLKAAFGSLMQKAISMALSGNEVTEDKMAQMLVDEMKQQSKLISEKYKETTLKVNCTKKDNAWYISDVTDEMKDVVTSGFVSASKDMGQILGGFGSQ